MSEWTVGEVLTAPKISGLPLPLEWGNIGAMNPLLAAGTSLGVALFACLLRALTPAGAGAAMLIGTAVLWGTGWPGGLVLGAFFGPSTLVGRIALAKRRTTDAAAERRGAKQVFANGGVAAAGALLTHWQPGLGFTVLTTALAAAAADTWATSIGAFSSTDPRLLLGGGRVPRGTSGGVSLLGTIGAGAGAVVVAGTSALVAGNARMLLLGGTIGVLGMLLDSVLGSAVQARFACTSCGRTGEKRRCECGSRTRVISGIPWLDNDGVNGVATLSAAGAGALAWWLGLR